MTATTRHCGIVPCDKTFLSANHQHGGAKSLYVKIVR
jgi:hypothetical protein